MPANSIIDYNCDTRAFEPRANLDLSAASIAWHVAAVRRGGTDEQELYQAASDGKIYHAESSDNTDDNGEPIAILYQTKFYDMGAVALVHSVWMRFAQVSDSVTLTVTAKGSEYGTVSQSYTISLNVTSGEVRQRVHRTVIGRYVQLQIAGNVSNRPALRNWNVRFIPVRQGRLTL